VTGLAVLTPNVPAPTPRANATGAKVWRPCSTQAEYVQRIYASIWGVNVHKRMTISIDETVYEGLVRVIGRRKISQFLEDLARPHVVNDDLVAGYPAMAADTAREREALE